MIDEKAAGRLLYEMVQISRTFRISGQRSRDQTMDGTRFGFLQHLRHHDARLGELAQQLLVSAPVASRAIDSLETDGLVQRRADPLDARASLISITDLGRARLTEGESHTVRQFADALEDWSPDDAAQAIHMLERLNTHLVEVTQHDEHTRTTNRATDAHTTAEAESHR